MEGNTSSRVWVGAYDATRPLIIDPVLSYATYVGGSAFDAGEDIAVDGNGAAYVPGSTESPDFPTKFSLQPGHAADDVSGDAFVTKLTADGTALVFSTFLGGTGSDSGSGIAVDADGAVDVTGFTTSSDFPTRTPLQPTLNDSADLFVAKLAADGTAVIYATYLGGSSSFENVGGIAVDAAAAAYVTGSTQSTDFPTTSAVQATYRGLADAFVPKLSPDGTDLLYATYLGGTDSDDRADIAVDATGPRSRCRLCTDAVLSEQHRSLRDWRTPPGPGDYVALRDGADRRLACWPVHGRHPRCHEPVRQRTARVSLLM